MKFTVAILTLAAAVFAAPMVEESCDVFCNDEYDPIVCSNGIVYGNACELEKAKHALLTAVQKCELHIMDGVTCQA
ncbi:hypothetical protein V2A60_009492 [Cordyceps javanica]|uniref:Kazal-like domain-containing protein n=1 Tax=Cordyceps javanica TaxID=43265 RepID=A0A545VMD8_9HYPO|nr:hypothetical protein IF1G_10183 [Cordyceps javanica]TQW02903.1 kazal-type serine protease inhibitor domain-containing protein [Cordyceps javanica]